MRDEKGKKKKQVSSWTDYIPLSKSTKGVFTRMSSWMTSTSTGTRHENSNYKKIVKKPVSSTLNMFTAFPHAELNGFNEFNSLHSDELENHTVEEEIKVEEFPNPNAVEPDIELVFVHGTMDRSSAFDNIIKKILPHLPPNISGCTTIAFTDRFTGIGISDYAKQILINYVLTNKIIPKKWFGFGHSRGVEVLHDFEVNFAAENNIEILGFFDFAGPIKGSPLANIVKKLGKSFEEMQSGSEFLLDLERRISERDKPHYAYIPEKDVLVPHKNQYLKKWRANIVPVPGDGHLSILDPQDDDVVDIPGHILKVLNGEDMTQNIETFLEQIDNFIKKQLQNKPHAFSVDNKVYVLEKLCFLLKGTAIGFIKDPYPNAKTIGHFITSFMYDNKNSIKGKLPIDILNTNLNFPSPNNTTSYFYLTLFMEKYKDIKLVREKQFVDKKELHNEHELVITETQTPRQNF